MKRLLLIFCLLFIAVKGFSQQFSQYNTGTLYDSFENPAQRAFVPDTSRAYAFNLLIPNFDFNIFLTGNSQASLMSKVYSGKFDNTALSIGTNSFNNMKLNANAYLFMFKAFTSLKGDKEVGVFAEMKSDGRARYSDETVALLNGVASFPSTIYDNIFNDSYHYQIYNEIGLSYREKLAENISFGVKLGLLMGIEYNRLSIDESHVSFDQVNGSANISVKGRQYISRGPGNFDARSFLPTTRSPGAQISIGATYKSDDHITFQGNIKDLGFIHWYGTKFNGSYYNDFNSTVTVGGLNDPNSKNRADNIYNSVFNLAATNRITGPYTTYTNGLFELSATKSYYLNADNTIKYSPTLILSKELLYNGVTGGMVNRFQYKKYNVSVAASYDNQSLLSLGLQLMLKGDNSEFFIGTNRLMQTVSLASTSGNSPSYSNGPSTGADFFLGYSIKFGPVIQHPLNSDNIPWGEKTFLARLWNRLFKTYQ